MRSENELFQQFLGPEACPRKRNGHLVAEQYDRQSELFLEQLELRDYDRVVCIDRPGGGETLFELSDDELEHHNRDREGFSASYYGLARDEYREWIALDGTPLCGCKTKTGLPCRNSVGRAQRGSQEWRQKHRRLACTIHKCVEIKGAAQLVLH